MASPELVLRYIALAVVLAVLAMTAFLAGVLLGLDHRDPCAKEESNPPEAVEFRYY